MLYDNKRWGKINVDPNSIAGLIAWLEKQPAKASYNWEDCEGRCLIGLYGAAAGIDWRAFHSHLWGSNKLSIASQEPHTFGAALWRARKLA